MATLSYAYGYFAEGTITYSVSSTETTTTIAVSRITLTSDYVGENTFTYSINCANTLLASGTFKLDEGYSSAKTLSASVSVGRTHVAQSIRLTVTGTGAGESTNDYTTITVAARRSYAVTFNANGGSNAPSSQTKWYGESLDLSAQTPTRASYEFWHWNTSTSNSGTSYSPGATYTTNAALSLYAIWNPTITYMGNGSPVGNIPPTQTKTYGTSINLSSATPTRTGYQFDGWYANSAGTGTKYTPGQAYTSNTAIVLYAKWLKLPEKPTVTSMSVVRCDSNGDQDDTGTYCKVTAVWSVDTTSDTVSNNTGTVTGTIREDGSSSTTSITFSSSASGTSGTAVALIDNCDTDKQYVIAITVTDLVTSVTRSDVLTRAFFTMDFRSGGGAIGIGVAAPSDGLEIGWPVQMNDDLNVSGDITGDNLREIIESTASNIISATGNWTIVGATSYTYGKVRNLRITASSSTALTAGTNYTVGFLTTDYTPNYQVTGAFSVGLLNIYQSYIQGTIRTLLTIRPLFAVSANNSVVIGITYYI